ncbi:hypothetical protein [Pseudomonas chlororaphis]
MSTDLTEEEMRLALFGSSNQAAPQLHSAKPGPSAASKPQTSPKHQLVARAHPPKLRVTLHVTKEFEGDIVVFTYDANTLSTFVAEQEAKNEAKKKKYRYFDVVSIKPI